VSAYSGDSGPSGALLGERAVLGAAAANPIGGIHREDFTNSLMTTVERTGLDVAGVDSEGKVIRDSDAWKTITEVYPIVEAAGGVSLNVEVGVQENVNSAVVWSPAVAFSPDTMRKVEITPVSGRLLSLRFSSAAASEWKLFGYRLRLFVSATGL